MTVKSTLPTSRTMTSQDEAVSDGDGRSLYRSSGTQTQKLSRGRQRLAIQVRLNGTSSLSSRGAGARPIRTLPAAARAEAATPHVRERHEEKARAQMAAQIYLSRLVTVSSAIAAVLVHQFRHIEAISSLSLSMRRLLTLSRRSVFVCLLHQWRLKRRETL